MKSVTLANGLKIPQIGLGTWQILDREQMNSTILNAYKAEYRLIDTAAAYSNEIAIAKAIATNGINRHNLFLSDKAWNSSRGYEAVQDACKKSLKKMKTDYFDLYLIHWPASMKVHADWIEINADTWRGMEQLYREGFVKSIGVCNFKMHHLEELGKSAEIMPMVNQVEVHPGFNQSETINYCNSNGIIIEASSPLGNGKILNNEQLSLIADSKGKTVAQICLRWEVQKGIVVIPKTTQASRLQQNMDIFDFELSDTEMEMIDNIPYCGGIGIDSDEVTEFG